MGQVYVHVESGDGVLLTLGTVFYAHRVADVFDADLIDRYVARVGRALYVRDRFVLFVRPR